jgi:2,3-bisphosphoglycerate-independent phosphoglycerate mutase
MLSFSTFASMNYKKAILIIMDGWGIGAKKSADAIAHAHTPFVSHLYNLYPHSQLITCGEAVGLPHGQMGNSEVGHLNLGAGRIVYQELERINVAIKDGRFKKNNTFVDLIDYCLKNKKKLHLMGLVSDGGVHAHINHLKAICTYAQQAGVEHVVHAFTDGRDTDPKSGYGFLQELQAHLEITGGRIATVTGRYYAMDRDKRWERVKIAYDALVHGQGTATTNVLESVEQAYNADVTDEFLKPIIAIDKDAQPIALLQPDDAVLCFNFRTDRCREITEVLTQHAVPEQSMEPIPLYYVTMTEYDHTYHNVKAIFHNDNLTHTLGQVIAENGLKQIRIAETEKYPHVTFFFSGGRETFFEGETRILKPSPKDVATYDLKPEMSAYDLTEAIIPELEQESADFVCLNFANADMVGHTGVWEAAIKAAETVDNCVSKIIPIALEHNYAVFLTADHGNSDYLVNDDGSPNTAHSLNPVPLFVISNDYKGDVKDGKLGDVAPSILHYMGLKIPEEMTGNILLDA